MTIYMILYESAVTRNIDWGPIFSTKEKAENHLSIIHPNTWIFEYQPKGEKIYIAEVLGEGDLFTYIGIYDDYDTAQREAKQSKKPHPRVSEYVVADILDKK